MLKNSKLKLIYFKNRILPIVVLLDEENQFAKVFEFRDMPMYLHFWSCLEQLDGWQTHGCKVTYFPSEASKALSLLIDYLNERTDAHMITELFALVREKKWEELEGRLAIRVIQKKLKIEESDYP